jgi:hypothetical protein
MRHMILIPPIITDLVYQAVSGVSGVQFIDAIPCSACGTLPVSHDLKRRRFSTVLTPEGPKHVYVYVKRFYCPVCRNLCYAPSPFYEKSRFGSPIVDLCIALSHDSSYSRAALLMNSLGIVIDRGTVRKTVLSHAIPVESMDFFGFQLPRSLIDLSSVVTSADPSGLIDGRDVLKACGFSPEG